MNTAKILEYIKQYLVISICVIVIIAALVGLPMVSTSWNADVQKQVKSRGQHFTKITNLEKTNFQVPGTGQTHTTVINQKLLDSYEQITAAMLDDAQTVADTAIKQNQQNHDVMMPELFPKPPEGYGAMDVLPKQFHERLVANYEQLLASINAGSPPPASEVEISLQAARRQFLEQMMAKDESDALTEEEAEQLKEQMTGERLEIYKDRAAEIGIYLTKDAATEPVFDRSSPPGLVELFSWQWTYWVMEELSGVIKALNGDRSELQNPLKRIDSIKLIGLMELNHQAGSSSSGGRGRGGGAGGGRPRSPIGGGMKPQGPTRGGQGRPPSSPRGGAPKKPAFAMATAPGSGSTNYDVSLSGRISNQLYDVVVVELDMVVATAAVAEVLDAFARQNFMTVIDLKMRPENAFEAIKEGYYYGGENTSRLKLVVETIWMRSWTRQHMPDEVRAMLGIPLDPPPAPAGGSPQGPPGRPGAPGRPPGPTRPGGGRP
ncbi:MAG: hypothetical protein CMJ24_05620 [Phycisphaerae bacterium]|nr:hypothetical protein [Phycisphaerae bacterium]